MHNANNTTVPFYHALSVLEEVCIGCSRCMRVCPTEA
ncbi:MAG: 4Fe-4S binding protein, partial [Bacteroidota bacterium]